MRITFLGGVGTVTGSKYLLEHEGRRVLVECGLFQGYKQLRLRNWSPPPVPPGSLDCVLLTHAHLDHSGYLPLLIRNGYRGRVICTEATRDLCGILLPDSGHLQEQDAEFANRQRFSKHHPALPLYTMEDAERSLQHLSAVPFHKSITVAPGIEARFLRAGHILGAAMIEITWGDHILLFSGDLGRPLDTTMKPPEVVARADWLVVESTYGNRKHNGASAEDALAEAIGRAAARGGSVIVPAFAVGRSQTLLVHLYRLRAAKRIPDLPIFFDSPMAIDATEIFQRHKDDHKLSAAEVRAAFAVARYVHTSEESKSLDQMAMPKVIVSASGMATGGRVLHHLKSYAPDRRSIILFTGFQAGGTRGAAMVAGAKSIKIHGHYIPVEAEVDNLDMLSAHADADEVLGWLRNFEKAPRATFITHGEPESADALRRRVGDELGWEGACVPDYRDEFELA
jgi:metallo-beta-lactamase family protein